MKNLLIILLIVLVLIVVASSLGGSLIAKPLKETYADSYKPFVTDEDKLMSFIASETRVPLPPTSLHKLDTMPVNTEEKFESVFDKIEMTNYNIEAFDNTQAFTVY